MEVEETDLLIPHKKDKKKEEEEKAEGNTNYVVTSSNMEKSITVYLDSEAEVDKITIFENQIPYLKLWNEHFQINQINDMVEKKKNIKIHISSTRIKSIALLFQCKFFSDLESASDFIKQLNCLYTRGELPYNFNVNKFKYITNTVQTIIHKFENNITERIEESMEQEV